MNREERIEKWAVIGVNARKNHDRMFGVYHVMKWLDMPINAYYTSRSKRYWLALQIINEMCDAGLAHKYSTSHNENVYRLSSYSNEAPDRALFRQVHKLPRFVTRDYVSKMVCNIYGRFSMLQIWISFSPGADFPCEVEFTFENEKEEDEHYWYIGASWLEIMMNMSPVSTKYQRYFDDIPF